MGKVRNRKKSAIGFRFREFVPHFQGAPPPSEYFQYLLTYRLGRYPTAANLEEPNVKVN